MQIERAPHELVDLHKKTNIVELAFYKGFFRPFSSLRVCKYSRRLKPMLLSTAASSNVRSSIKKKPPTVQLVTLSVQKRLELRRAQLQESRTAISSLASTR